MKKILLVGNPNCGKSTFFNAFANENQHVGNWHGVTTGCKEKILNVNGNEVCLVDTPGIYSLSSFSFEEEETLKALNDECKIINICDRDNIQNGLYLTLCLLEKGLDVVLYLNCTKKVGKFFVDSNKIEKLLSVKTIAGNAKKKQNFLMLEKELFSKKKNCFLPYFDDEFEKMSIEKQVKVRFDFVDEILRKCCKKREKNSTEKIDRIVLNKVLCLPIFFGVMLCVFYLTFFSLGKIFSDVLQDFFSLFLHPCLDFLQKTVGNGWFFDLFDKAIVGGIFTIVSFLPQVVLLFFFLSLLEESGYMSRVAFVFDDILDFFGLSGKSVYTLMMCFGCSTSAIMTAKIVDDENARIKAALACPYISCSAKIPIYAVIGSAFFGEKNLFVIFGMYVLGIVVCLCVSAVLNKTLLKTEKNNFILEFPSYRIMSFRKILSTLFQNAKDFIKKIGGLILCCNIIVFVLSSFSFSLDYVRIGSGKSILEWLANLVYPIFVQLGFSGSASVCVLLSGFVAKEVIVSSIALFNGISGENINGLSNSVLLSTNSVYFPSVASAISFLIFCLLYTPCISSMLMLSKEVGRKWTVFAFLLQLFVSYVLSLVAYNIVFAADIFGFRKVVSVFVGLLFVAFSVIFIYKRLKKGKNCLNCAECDGHSCKK